MKKVVLSALVFSVVCVIVLSASTLTLFNYGPKVETKLFPVFTEVSAIRVPDGSTNSKEFMHMMAVGNKVRQCEWLQITAMIQRDGQWHQGQVYFTDPRAERLPQSAMTPSRPLGRQHLGDVFVYPAGERLEIRLRHRCHPLWVTETILYDVDVTAVTADPSTLRK